MTWEDHLRTMVAGVVLAAILWLGFLEPMKRSEDFRTCCSATGQRAACERMVYPDKAASRDEWRRRVARGK